MESCLDISVLYESKGTEEIEDLDEINMVPESGSMKAIAEDTHLRTIEKAHYPRRPDLPKRFGPVRKSLLSLSVPDVLPHGSTADYKAPYPKSGIASRSVPPRNDKSVSTQNAAKITSTITDFVAGARESLFLALDMITTDGWSGQTLISSLRRCVERKVRIDLVTTAFTGLSEEVEYAARFISDVSQYAAVFILEPPIPRVSYAISDFKTAVITWRIGKDEYGCCTSIGEGTSQIIETIRRFDRWRAERLHPAWILPRIQFVSMPRGVDFEWEDAPVGLGTTACWDYQLGQMKSKYLKYESDLRRAADGVTARAAPYPKELLEVEAVPPSPYYGDL